MEYTIGTKVFRDWEIVAEIGEGSYGKVYQLRKENFGIVANGALKVIRIPRSPSDVKDALSQGMDEQSVTSYFKGVVDEFMREVAVMSDMKSHPNVVGCQDYDIIPHAGGMGWDILIRMDLLIPLQEYQTRNTMDEAQVRRLGTDLCEALVYCQKRGLIHRDIKPGNIFVDELGRFRLGDFGVARTADKTMGGMSKQGTENYMAPEVYLGKEYGPTVDIYSLGMVLYQLMNANRLPFYPLPPAPIEFSHRFDVLKKRMSGVQMPPPCSASEDFAAIILKACSFESRDRYRTAADLLEALRGTPAAAPGFTYSTPEAPQQPVGEPFVPVPQQFSFGTPTGDETIGPAFAPRAPKAESQPAPPSVPEFNAPPKAAPGFGGLSAPAEGASGVLGMELGETYTRISCMEPGGEIRTLQLATRLGCANGRWYVGEEALRCCSNAIHVLNGPSDEEREGLTGRGMPMVDCIAVYLEQVMAYARSNGMDGKVLAVSGPAFMGQKAKKLLLSAFEKAGLGRPCIYPIGVAAAARYCTQERGWEGLLLHCHFGDDLSEVSLIEYGDDVIEVLYTRENKDVGFAQLVQMQRQMGASLSEAMDRQRYQNEAADELFLRMIATVQSVLRTNTENRPLARIVVSGSLAQVFRWKLASLLEQEPVVMNDCAWASAQGAAVLADTLSPMPAGHPIMLLNILNYTYQVNRHDSCGELEVVLTGDRCIPAKDTMTDRVSCGEEFLLFEDSDDPDPDDPPIERFTASFTGEAKFTLWVEADGIVRFSLEPAEGTAPGKTAQPKSKQANPNAEPRAQSGTVNFGKIVRQVLARHPEITPGSGIYQEESLAKLKLTLGDVHDNHILLAHDDSWFKRGKNGFILANKGIHVKDIGGKVQVTSWEEFARGRFVYDEKQPYQGEINGKPVYYCSDPDAQQPLRRFFEDLHQTMRQAL